MGRTSYTRADLEKLLVQDFGCTYDAARLAIGRYYAESQYGIQPWWVHFSGGWNEMVAITEWIWGTKRYWRKRRAPRT